MDLPGVIDGSGGKTRLCGPCSGGMEYVPNQFPAGGPGGSGLGPVWFSVFASNVVLFGGPNLQSLC